MRKFIHIIFSMLLVSVVHHASACTISEDMLESVPLNYEGIPNNDRLKMADMVASARRWPDVEIQASIVANAYVGEKNAPELAKSRGEQLKAFLIQLGVKSQYISVDSHIVRVPYPADSTGPGGFMQLGVSLTPLCKRGCDQLCNDPRVTPNTKVVQ
ncbi:hypothetical protein [Paraburkholderia bannensis]|uniref:hypothetical protein n=1 Tax=Paraburkholderia bannensis TaxID=765414 RepID=UPI002AB05144|nr:hypothetical protein [Paraburkholderia bannensis]